MGKLQVTIWKNPNHEVKTVLGAVKYLDWLKKEKERIEKSSLKKLQIFTSRFGNVSLWEVEGNLC